MGDGRLDFLKVYIIYERMNVYGWRGVSLGGDDERKERNLCILLFSL
jgi:hypothetical protein